VQLSRRATWNHCKSTGGDEGGVCKAPYFTEHLLSELGVMDMVSTEPQAFKQA